MEASRKSNFLVDRFRGFAMWFRDTNIPLTGSVDADKLEEFISEIAHSIDVPPINAGLVFDGSKIKSVKGQKGRVVDQAVLKSQLKDVLLSLETAELQVPMTVKDPTVLADDFDQALQQAVTMTGASITLTNGSDSWTLTAEDIVAYMDFRAESKDGKSVLIPYLSADKMAPFLMTSGTLISTCMGVSPFGLIWQDQNLFIGATPFFFTLFLISHKKVYTTQNSAQDNFLADRRSLQ